MPVATADLRKGYVQVRAHDGMRWVEGFICGPLIIWHAGALWIVGQRSTGQRIAAFSSLGLAREFASRIAIVADWDTAKLSEREGLRRAVMEIAEEVEPE